MGLTSRLGAVVLMGVTLYLLVALSGGEQHQTALPTSKLLTLPTPGASWTSEWLSRHDCIRSERRIRSYPQRRLRHGRESGPSIHCRSSTCTPTSSRIFRRPAYPVEAHQTYFLGLAFGSDGKHLYASMASLTDPTGARPGNTGNGIAVYGFRQGKLLQNASSRSGPKRSP